MASGHPLNYTKMPSNKKKRWVCFRTKELRDTHCALCVTGEGKCTVLNGEY